MKPKMIIKVITDILMTIAMLFLMGYQFWGETAHEWVGAGVFVLFILHHVLNWNWYKSMFRGKYSPARVFIVVVDILVFASMIGLMVSGIMLSREVFAFFRIRRRMSFARTLHVAATHWGFILMSLHLGLHWNMLIRMAGKMLHVSVRSRIRDIICFLIAAGIAAYGAYVFISRDFPMYMTLKMHFVFLDFEEPKILFYLDYLAMMGTFIFIGHYVLKLLKKIRKPNNKAASLLLVCVLLINLSGCANTQGNGQNGSRNDGWNFSQEAPDNTADSTKDAGTAEGSGGAKEDNAVIPENFVLIKGGTFEMGSHESEAWRSEDEKQHSVTVSDFYMSIYEVTQKEYHETTGSAPSNFTGENLPVENVSWIDAIRYCNARSEKENLTPAYTVDGQNVSWNRSANGYRLPTEAEWEYACRAGTTTPFYMENSPSAEEANYYGHYPYMIEENYFSQGNLEVKPGEYRQTTVAVGSFAPNPFGLYDMHGNVGEWTWDAYGPYPDEAQVDPAGASTGTRRVYRGGGWNDFAKNMRSAYRATLDQDKGSFNIGIRLVRNASAGSGSVSSAGTQNTAAKGGKTLIAYFSWGGNTRGIAQEIQRQTGADLFEITLVHPYSSNYNTVLNEAQRDQNIQARPEISNHVQNMSEYDTILLGYPNWWASIPMPIASFLEEYDFSGKTIIPFCSHGGGRFGQSLTAIAKLAPNAVMGEGLSVHYSGGSSLSEDVRKWIETNHIVRN